MSIQLLAGTAVVKGKKVLLLKTGSEDTSPGWGPPAGHGNDSETPLGAAIRETKEETNLDIKISGVVQAGFLSYKGKDYAFVLYLASPVNIKELKIQKEEAQDFVWASLSDIKKDKYPLRKRFLKKPLILALTQKPSPTNTFTKFFIED